MSAAWDNHMARLNGLLSGAAPAWSPPTSSSPVWQNHMAQFRGLLAQNAPPPPPAAAPMPAIEAAALPQYDVIGEFRDGNGGGAPLGGDYTGTGGSGQIGLQGMMPNSTTLAQMTGVDPLAARGLLSLAGMSNPLAGAGLMGMNMFGNIANTSSNVGMLNNLNVNPGIGSMLGGAFGFNGLAGLPAGALNFAMANQMPGFANLSSPQMPGDFSMSGWGGWADIANEMGPTAGNAPSSSRDGIEVEQL